LAKELQDEYLVARVYGETTDDEDHDEVALRHRTLRDAALFFEMMLLGADDTSQEYIQDALEVAATVFEFLSRATPERVFRDWVEQEGFVECLLSGPLNDLLRAGLLYSLAGKPANGYLLLQRLVKTAERLLESCNQEELGEARLATWVIGCLGYLMAARREDLDEATRLSFMVEDLRLGSKWHDKGVPASGSHSPGSITRIPEPAGRTRCSRTCATGPESRS